MHDQAQALALLAAVLLAGCRDATPAAVAAKRQPARAPASAAAGPVVIKPLDERDVARMIRGHRGDVLLLNFWATWCKPCVKELPGIVRLARELEGRGLRVVLLSTDEVVDEAKVRAMIRRPELRGPLTHYVVRASDYEAFVNAVHRQWIGGVPATFVFDRQGKLRFHHLGERTRDQLAAVVSKHL